MLGITHAQYGEDAVKAGAPDHGSNDERTNVVDALANIMHYCHERDVSFAGALDWARDHFEAERAED